MTPVRRFAAVAAALVALGAGPVQRATFRSGVDGVLVSVSVRNQNRPVAGLMKDDFTLRDNGVVQPILDATIETRPLDVVFFIDLSGSVTSDQLDGLRRTVTEVAGRLKPGDRCALDTFTRRILERAPLASPPIAFDLTRPDKPHARDTSLADALALALVSAPSPDRRQLAIVLTDARDNASFFDLDAVQGASKFSDRALDIVVSRGSGLQQVAARSVEPPAEFERRLETLAAIASATGGRLTSVAGSGDAGPAFLDAIDELRTSYVLRYMPAGVAPDGWHELSVRITGVPDDEVRARQGYFRR